MEKKIIKFIKNRFSSSEIVALHSPFFDEKEKKYLNECIDSTFVSSVGPFVEKFDNMLGGIIDSNVVSVVNGTAALHISLKLVGVTKNDEVITQPLTFVATANAINYNNAHPIFLDVDLDTMGLSPDSVSNFLEEFGDIRDGKCYNKISGRRIAACLPMHTFGFPVRLDELIRVCNKWKIPIVEDAAESLGSEYKGKKTGTFGDFGVFSFNGNKIITSGGGGAIVTNNKYLAKKAKYLITTAKRPHPYEYFHTEIGYNFRMPNINAALACAQLEKLEKFIERKRSLALDYFNFFKENGIKFKTEPSNSKSNYWLMCIELENKSDRDNFLKCTNEEKVITRPIWTLMSKLPMYDSCQKDDLKNANYLQDRIVNIPSSVCL